MFAESSASKGDFYRQLLKQSRLFLTEVDENADLQENSRSTFSSRSTSTSTSTSPPRPTARNHRRANSALALRSSSSSSPSRHPVDDQLVDTRQRCHQRLLTCSRKKLRLLNLQEQNERRHLGFKRFVDSLDEKRSANIRRYQMELRDYLLNRLETDRLKEELLQLKDKIDLFKEEKKKYLAIIDLVQKAIPLFPPGTLQGGTDGIRSLILRYQTLVETKQQFEQRDFSNEKQEKRREYQLLILSHHTNVAKLNTRLSQLHGYLNELQKNESIREERMINQIDLNRIHNATLSQLLSSINYLYDRYRLVYQLKQAKADATPKEKLRAIQEFILYRIDWIQRAKHLSPSVPLSS